MVDEKTSPDRIELTSLGKFVNLASWLSERGFAPQLFSNAQARKGGRGALAALGDKVGAEEAEGVGGGEVGEGGEGEAAEFGQAGRGGGDEGRAIAFAAVGHGREIGRIGLHEDAVGGEPAGDLAQGIGIAEGEDAREGDAVA